MLSAQHFVKGKFTVYCYVKCIDCGKVAHSFSDSLTFDRPVSAVIELLQKRENQAAPPTGWDKIETAYGSPIGGHLFRCGCKEKTNKNTEEL